MNWPALFDAWPLIGATICGLVAAAQVVLVRRLGLRLFGLAMLFGSASAVFGLTGRDGRIAGGDDPATQAAALCILLVGLGVIGVGAALALRHREDFGQTDDAEALRAGSRLEGPARPKARR